MAPPRRKRNNSSMPSQEEEEHVDSVSRHEEKQDQEERQEEEEISPADLAHILITFGRTQKEMVDTMKQLKAPSFVTQDDVVAMLEKELRRSSEDWKYAPQLPYPSSKMHLAYPKNYERPTFTLFDGRKGSPKEHISRFLDALGPHASNHNLRLREFSKTFTDRAYTWYTTLDPGCIRSWDEMAGKFCRKYFQYEERVTIAQLNNTRQKTGENLVDFVCYFRDLALDCYDEKDEESLVEICISSILPDRVYLENIGIAQFSRLIEAVFEEEGKVWNYPVVPCTDEELHAILDTLFADGVIKPMQREKPPTMEEKKNPRYSRYHQIVGHPTLACQTLRRILHAKIDEGTLELPSKKQAKMMIHCRNVMEKGYVMSSLAWEMTPWIRIMDLGHCANIKVPLIGLLGNNTSRPMVMIIHGYARQAAAEALMNVSEAFGPQCFVAGSETQRGRSLLGRQCYYVYRQRHGSCLPKSPETTLFGSTSQ
ncbi:uncharacterized protein LOC133716276 [Rosa rugosa]|uniref:uncharacterized protein LOC133716276 n=1 Tax=Rosa rugosa TaxID=74645 RepID=UPI002B4105F9|nr:uncharacterized protein LOC133716276 [Rosa rugosa]